MIIENSINACVIKGLFSGDLCITPATAHDLVQAKIIEPFGSKKNGHFRLVKKVDEEVLWKALRQWAHNG